MTTDGPTAVLLIEDDEVDREAVHRAVGSVFRLLDANDGQSGLQAAQQHRPDCVLLDYRLPDTDGVDLLPKLVAARIPVVMMTGAGNESIAVDAMKLGASDYISKHLLSPPLLTQSIRRAIDSAALQRKISEQQEELENFVSIASHDLRAPLRHIIGFAKLARDSCRGAGSQEVEGYLDRVVDGGLRMEKLLNSLSEFARSGRIETELEPVDLDSVVAQALANLSAEISESNATIETAALPKVSGHEPSLIELIQNLIDNAIKYAGTRAPMVRISASCEGNTCTVQVSDSGIGIEAEYQERIFQPFRRLHSYAEIEGSGIGLANCRRIVEHHRGRIWVESTPAAGSTFSFTLECADTGQQGNDICTDGALGHRAGAAVGCAE